MEQEQQEPLGPRWWMIPAMHLMTRIHSSNSDTLAHYTDATGLCEIAKSEELWATDLRYVNDATELREYLNLCIDELEVAPAPAMTREFLNHVIAALRGFDQPVYSVSFTAGKDDIGQWRGYCPNGRGYSMVFKTRVLRQLQAPPIEWLLAPCHYDDAIHRDVTKKAIAYIVDNFDQERQNADQTWEDNFKNMVVRYFMYLAPFLKNKHFKPELEWRMVARGTHSLEPLDPKIRIRHNALVPYLPLLLKYPPGHPHVENYAHVAEIIVGPTHDKDRQVGAVQTFTRMHPLLQLCVVHPSDIPYRSL